MKKQLMLAMGIASLMGLMACGGGDDNEGDTTLLAAGEKCSEDKQCQEGLICLSGANRFCGKELDRSSLAAFDYNEFCVQTRNAAGSDAEDIISCETFGDGGAIVTCKKDGGSRLLSCVTNSTCGKLADGTEGCVCDHGYNRVVINDVAGCHDTALKFCQEDGNSDAESCVTDNPGGSETIELVVKCQKGEVMTKRLCNNGCDSATLDCK